MCPDVCCLADNRILFEAYNKGDRLMTVTLTPTGDNLANCASPFEAVLQPRSSGTYLGEVWQEDVVAVPHTSPCCASLLSRRQAWTYKYSFTFKYGDAHAVHDDDFLYKMPFSENTSLRCCQGLP